MEMSAYSTQFCSTLFLSVIVHLIRNICVDVISKAQSGQMWCSSRCKTFVSVFGRLGDPCPGLFFFHKHYRSFVLAAQFRKLQLSIILWLVTVEVLITGKSWPHSAASNYLYLFVWANLCILFILFFKLSLWNWAETKLKCNTGITENIPLTFFHIQTVCA